MKIKITPQLEYSLSDVEVTEIITSGSTRHTVKVLKYNYINNLYEKYIKQHNWLLRPKDLLIINGQLFELKVTEYGYGDYSTTKVPLSVKLSEKELAIIKGFEDLLGVI